MDPEKKKELKRNITTISEVRKERLDLVLRRRQTDLTLVLENIWDPHNVSAILRSADAVGVRTVHLLYHIETAPDLKKIGKQSSASAKKWLTFRNHSSVADCFSELHDEGFTILASHLTKFSASLYDLNLTGKIALVMGNETRGVSDEACALADGGYFIPMMGMVQSLNASVAAAVSLFEACRQRLNAGSYNQPTIEETALNELLTEWAMK
jgi:tRNA (guanosine-2'-O-)-methyltransferase